MPAEQVLWLTAAVRGIAGRMLRRYSWPACTSPAGLGRPAHHVPAPVTPRRPARQPRTRTLRAPFSARSASTASFSSSPTMRATAPPRPVRAALGSLAPLESRALRDRQTRVARKGGVPYGARAPQVGGAPPRLVELRMPACFTEPRLCAELQPRIGRAVRHERRDMRLAWQGVSCHTQVRGRLPAGRGTCRDPFHRLSGRCGGSRHMPKITRFHRPGRFQIEQCGTGSGLEDGAGRALHALARHAGSLRGFAPRGHTMGG